MAFIMSLYMFIAFGNQKGLSHATLTYTGGHLIDSKIDRSGLSNACSVSRFLTNLHFSRSPLFNWHDSVMRSFRRPGLITGILR